MAILKKKEDKIIEKLEAEIILQLRGNFIAGRMRRRR